MVRSEAQITGRQAEIALAINTVGSAGLVVFFGWLADASYWFSVPVGVVFGFVVFMGSAVLLGTAPTYFDPRREDELIHEYRGTDRQLGLLAELNRQELLRYHDIVTKQAAQSFRAGQLAAGAGLVVIGACLWVGLSDPGFDVKWFSGAIAGVATAVSAYINRTYMHMYEKSIDQLSRYFEQPVVTGYYLTAERMAKADLEEGLRNRIIGSVLGTAMFITTKKSDPAPPTEEHPRERNEGQKETSEQGQEPGEQGEAKQNESTEQGQEKENPGQEDAGGK
ncbi:MAG: hypothetical protein JF597_47035 [Streptomyces sp.]|jgi:hypothetical protein|uniref:TRADD-N-associated membrane domain-containing protein n=1 Tax=Streptomyces sp. TaxID=1931 RepID=UPI0025E31731|nr:hypothetical protein [Streptomyces sp.]MBW8800849.1 hypothetical protein [Streptomyces sp.]